MRISTEQERLIDGLRCERLASNEVNFRQVDEFFCRRNDSLAAVLQNEAFEDDECGSTAYYLVKDGMGRILFYFSLKTGLLYDQHIDEKSIKIFKKLNDFVRDAVSQQDLKEELVHFCKNNAHDEVIRGLGLPRNFGEVVFWRFIVPKIVEARRLIGIQYFFLFAADMTAENKLIQYYSDFLHFKTDDARATVKPVYDFACKFMYQPTSELEDIANAFWDNFNEDDEV